MHSHVETLKAILGCKTDRELARLFKKKSMRTVQAWKQFGIPRGALRELRQICEAREVELDAELVSGLTVGVAGQPQDNRRDAA